jgi:hypothetical protein
LILWRRFGGVSLLVQPEIDAVIVHPRIEQRIFKGKLNGLGTGRQEVTRCRGHVVSSCRPVWRAGFGRGIGSILYFAVPGKYRVHPIPSVSRGP